jgi:cellobiose phosphorylase
MNLDHGSGRAESVFCAEQFCRAMLDLAELAEAVSRPAEADHFRALHAEMAGVVNRVAWDGEWYARSYDDEGRPVGVASEEKQKINLMAQTWAVVGDVAPRPRAEKAMQSVHAKLNSKFGLAVLWPPYAGGNPRVNGTATFPPGAKENGGIFCHANTWAIIAAAKLGWAERALQYYHQITPFLRDDLEVLKTEPYVFCGNICGPTHPQFGYGRNAWLSGTAAWMYVAATQWILGIRPTHKGLQIAPAIPGAWRGFNAKRIFRGVTYHIAATRKGRGQGKVKLRVDGRPVAGNVVPMPRAGVSEVKVEVELR